jgi:HAMP domain-containing protein
MTLRLKFNLVLIAAMGVGLGTAWLFTERTTTQEARSAVLAEAAAIMGAADAVRDYTSVQVQPLLATQMHAQFLPQSVPFFALLQTMEKLTQRSPEYKFRLPTTNPTNPADRPLAWEAEIIEQLAADPALKEIVVERTEAGRDILSYAQPIVVESGACLVCHSTPDVAPRSMIDIYGSANGFGWKVGETIGAKMVSVSQEIPRARARKNLIQIMVGLTGVLSVMFVVLNVLLHFSIIQPIRRMSQLADQISLGNMAVGEFATSVRGEIGLLAVSFNRMRRSLVTAMKMLGD